MNQQRTKQVEEERLEPYVTRDELYNARRYSDLVEKYDMLRRWDIRYRTALKYYQREQVERIRRYESELRRTRK